LEKMEEEKALVIVGSTKEAFFAHSLSLPRR
jgi:hypothetical protein